MGTKIDLKIVLLGKEYGGKTCLVERYMNDYWPGDTPYQNTIGAAFTSKRVTVRGARFTIGVWDTAGSERYEAMSRIYYRGAKAAIVCFDLSDKEGFERTFFWIKELLQHEPGCKIYLCGTKYDLVELDKDRRGVEHCTSQDHADASVADYFETSSKTGKNVFELFEKITDDFYVSTYSKIEERARATSSFHLDQPKTKGVNCCSG